MIASSPSTAVVKEMGGEPYPCIASSPSTAVGSFVQSYPLARWLAEFTEPSHYKLSDGVHSRSHLHLPRVGYFTSPGIDTK